MHSFLVQLRDTFISGNLHYFTLFFVAVWLRWFIVQSTALFYNPAQVESDSTTAVIIPVVDEEVDLFRKVLDSVTAQKPERIVVVINGPLNNKLRELCKSFNSIQCKWTKKPGKRNAIRLGLKSVKEDITVLVDSDTIWTENTLTELKKPFVSESVGGVTTKQKIICEDKKLLTRFCDWIEDIRAYGTMPAMSVFGKVGCLPGRTIAFRTQILKDVMSEFMSETFMNIHKEVSDDRSLTNLTLQKGYKTVYQETSVVYTAAPTNWKMFVRQQLRWAEGSQYNNIKMLPWMLKNAKFTLFIFLSDMLIPFMLGSVYLTYFGLLLLGHTNAYMMEDSLMTFSALTFVGAWLSLSLRQLAHFSRKPIDILYTLPFIIVLTFIMLPIRILGFSKLADDSGWGTRKNAYKSEDHVQSMAGTKQLIWSTENA